MTKRQIVAWVLIAIASTYSLLIGGAPAGVELPILRIVSLVIIAMALSAWFLLGRRDRSWRSGSVLTPGLLACVGALAIATMFSRDPRISLEYLIYAGLLAALYVLLVQLLRRPWLRSRIVALAGMIGLILAGAYVVLSAASWAELWTLVGHVGSPPLRPEFQSLVYANPAPVLVVEVLLCATAIGGILTSAWGVRHPKASWAASAAVAAVAFVAAVLTGTRGGLFAIGIAFLALLAVAIAQPASRRVVRGALTRGRQSVALVVAIGVTGILSMAVLGPGLLQRLSAGGEEFRAEFYVIALRMFEASPIVGLGPGMWAVERIAYTRPGELDLYVPHAHEVYLQSAAESGMVGLLAGGFAVALLVRLLRDGFADSDRNRRTWSAVATFASVFFAASQLVDFHLNIPATIIALGLPIAVIDATAVRRRQLPAGSRAARRWASRVTVPATSVALAVAVGFALWSEGAAMEHQAAVDLANAGDWKSAAGPAERAEELDPGMPIYRLTAGLAEANIGDLVQAETDFSNIATIGQLPEAWLDLADVQWQRGEAVEARASLSAASKFGLQRPPVAMAIAGLALSMGDENTAVSAGAAAIAGAPSLAGDPWWTTDGQSIRGRVFAQALTMVGPDQRWEIALESGADAAEALHEAPGASATASEVIAAWAGNTNAIGQLYFACDASPVSGPIDWCTRVAEHIGDDAAAKRFAEVGLIVGWPEEQLGEWRIAPPGSVAVSPPTGSNAVYYGVEVYRRFTPWDLLLSDLPHVYVEGVNQ